MATYQAPFQRDAITEVVPRALELSSLSKSSLLTGRRRIRVIPQTGQTYGSASGGAPVAGSGLPTLANILVQDSAGLLDMQSVVLSMNVTVQTLATTPGVLPVRTAGAAGSGGTITDAAVDPYMASIGATLGGQLASANVAGHGYALPKHGVAGANVAAAGAAYYDGSLGTLPQTDALTFGDVNDPIRTAVLDDFAWSVFRRIQISLNSQLVDDLDYCGRRATTEVYGSASPTWYDTIGTVMGAWKLTQKEFIQPKIVAPQGSNTGGTVINVTTIPVKSRVQSDLFAQYAHNVYVNNVQAADNVVSAQVVSALNINNVGGVPLNTEAAPYVAINGAVGQLQGVGGGPAAGTSVGVNSPAPIVVQPIALGSNFVGPVARTDVLSKLYGTSAFMRGVFWRDPTSQNPLKPVLGFDNMATNLSTNNAWVLNATGAGPKFSIPLGLLSHLFRQEQLFPLRNAGQLIIQIQFADALECCYAGFLRPSARHTGGGATLVDYPTFQQPGDVAIGYRIDNLELECDIVTAIPEYTSILDSICSRPADKGLAIAFDSHLSSLQQVTGTADVTYGAASGGGSAQTFTLIASKGSENVRSFHWTFSPTAGIRSPYYLQNSTFPAYNLKQWQLRVGSVYYPAFPSQGLSKNYMELLSSVNAPMPSVGQASLINYDMFRQSTPSYQWYLASPPLPAPAPSITGVGALEGYRYEPSAGVFSVMSNKLVTGALQIDPATSFMADAYIGGYCFDNLKHAEPLSHDGIDTRAIAGGMIQLDFTCEPLEAFCVVFHIRFTRTIVLAENGVSIIG
jgi:hypothetical protein